VLCSIVISYLAITDFHVIAFLFYFNYPSRSVLPSLPSPSIIILVIRWLNTNEVFYLATQGGAEALSMGDVVGNFLVGKKLDCLVIDVNSEGSPIDSFGEENVYSLFEKFVYIGDDRNIAQVLVNGKVVDHN
jgi:hypothetical protein